MSLSRVFCIYFVLLTYDIENVFTAALIEKSTALKNKINQIESNPGAISSKDKILSALDITFNLHEIEENQNLSGPEEFVKTRRKRQSGAGKYTDAAGMGQMKVFRLWLQLFKNTWASVYVGGAHPFHRDVPKGIVFLFKHKIMDFFFPAVGVPDKTQ